LLKARYALATLAILSLSISALPLWLVLLVSIVVVWNTCLIYQNSLLSVPQFLNWRAGDSFLLWNYRGQFESLHQPKCQRQGLWWIISGTDSKQRIKRILISPDMLNVSQHRQLALLAAIPNNESLA
jgi:hypothetical protein